MQKLYLKLPELSVDDIRAVPTKFTTSSFDEEYDRTVHCYSKGAFFAGHKTPEIWDNPLGQIRGVVSDENDNILCRGLPKFFNYGEPRAQDWRPGKSILLEKFNGFCAHIWFDTANDMWRYTTKAGIAHDFEGYMIDLMDRELLFGFPLGVNSVDDLDEGFVYICEAIHVDDPHTVPTPEGLYLLASIDRRTWTLWIDTERFPGEVHVVSCVEEAEALQNTAQHEGYVAYHIGRIQRASNMHPIEEIMKLKTDYYWNLRQAKNPDQNLSLKKTMEVEVLDNLLVTIDRDAIMSSIGEAYDDWYAKNLDRITEILHAMQSELDANTVWFEDWVAVHGMDRKKLARAIQVATEVENLSLPIIMAHFDKSVTKMDRIFKRRLTEILK